MSEQSRNRLVGMKVQFFFYFQYDVSRYTLRVSSTVLRKNRNTDFQIVNYILQHEKKKSSEEGLERKITTMRAGPPDCAVELIDRRSRHVPNNRTPLDR